MATWWAQSRGSEAGRTKLRTQLLLGYVVVVALMIVMAGIMQYSMRSVLDTQKPSAPPA